MSDRRGDQRPEPGRNQERGVDGCETRRRGIGGEAAVQAALVVLFVALAAVTWVSIVGAFGR